MGITINDLYDLEHTRAAEYLSQFTYPGEWGCPPASA